MNKSLITYGLCVFQFCLQEPFAFRIREWFSFSFSYLALASVLHVTVTHFTGKAKQGPIQLWWLMAHIATHYKSRNDGEQNKQQQKYVAGGKNKTKQITYKKKPKNNNKKLNYFSKKRNKYFPNILLAACQEHIWNVELLLLFGKHENCKSCKLKMLQITENHNLVDFHSLY